MFAFFLYEMLILNNHNVIRIQNILNRIYFARCDCIKIEY